ncbi:class I SAM-dependent methyltransferase [Comamonas piscis]|uniref:Class I SAM-dependent methyltransferase n=1 Tax=Comamonas piscis TaxID=1562974 RepID=A0A7G5EFK9_9BURK|nr:class I SAM-dependent methyltransferase [Comamonas piscis]QMV72784.1 class I SAM-dependent methyltransferase [Comamonas piscis]WSO35559.1 class I SAM-dependent methyltransferase [Comamonas piscis]
MTTAQPESFATIQWEEGGEPQSARWRCERGTAPSARVVLADDTMPADVAYRLACQGTALLWRGDFQNARMLLQSLARRLDKTGERKAKKKPAAPSASGMPTPQVALPFHQQRHLQAQRARVLSMVLIGMDAQYAIALRRAPEVQAACADAWGAPEGDLGQVVSLRELQALVGAHEWRKKGVEIPALAKLAPKGYDRIHPHYGVFSPVRGEYVDLIAQAPLPTALAKKSLAYDIGTGTGVIAAVLARRGIQKIVATDTDPRALACARENLERLGVDQKVELAQTDLFPEGKAALVVCNPPWVPAKPSAPVERAVYDEGSRMLRGFLAGVSAHLAPGGEAWLILSDFAEHLGLRSREELLSWIAEAGLQVVGKNQIRPRHAKAQDSANPLHQARAAEMTTLWRLQVGW